MLHRIYSRAPFRLSRLAGVLSRPPATRRSGVRVGAETGRRWETTSPATLAELVNPPPAAASQRYQVLLGRERTVFKSLAGHLKRLDASAEDTATMTQLLEQLDSKFLMVVVGEFNAGKSTFVNALLGGRFLKSGVTPTTARICVVEHSGSSHIEDTSTDVDRVQLDVPWLREIEVVDTPGTNAIILDHQRITEHFVPRADLVLFVTSAYAPFSESERQFLSHITAWGKKVVVLLNKIDAVDDPQERTQIIDFVQDNVRSLLDTETDVIPVSARSALAAKTADPPQSISGTGFDALEQLIVHHLDSTSRLAIKLASPLAGAQGLAEGYLETTKQRIDVLAQDYDRLQEVDRLLVESRTRMREGLDAQLERVDSALYRLAERGDQFFEDTITLSRVFDLANADKIRREFEVHVVSDLSSSVDSHVHDFIDWFVEGNHKLWHRVHHTLTQDTVSRRRRRTASAADASDTHKSSLVTQMDAYDFGRRTELLDHIGSSANHVVHTFDRKKEAAVLADQLRNTLMMTVGIQGAAGLGAALLAAMTDVTGTLLAGMLAVGGLYVLPYRRKQMQSEMRTKINVLQQQLNDSLTDTFEEELECTERTIRDAVAPYTQFVMEEGRDLEKVKEGIEADLAELERVQREIRSGL